MTSWFSEIFDKSSYFMPHGHCYLWIPGLLWLHVISDVLIGSAYLGISLILYVLVRRMRLPFSPLFIAFGLFIALCGLTHFVAVWTVWNPDYVASGLVKGATAAASVATAVGLFMVRPQLESVVTAARLSEQRRVELENTYAELQALYQKNKELDEHKTRFFANISHELRTPLALIIGPAEQMKHEAGLTSAQQQQLDTISRNSKSLLRQVNDLLDIARLEEGKMPMHYAATDLVLLMTRITNRFELAADQRGIALSLNTPETLVADVDPNMFERVYINLLSNALKFTAAGGAIDVHLVQDNDRVDLSVKDTGIGIAAAEKDAIFDRFRQVDGSATRTRGGSGLGLAIVKDFVELHKGTLHLDSEVGNGSTFRVTLPLRTQASIASPVGSSPDSGDTHTPSQASEVSLDSSVQSLALPDNGPDVASQPSGDASPSRKATVLVVDDTADIRRFIVSILQETYHVITAQDGREGLERALTDLPDLVITDIMMPHMSGDEMVTTLRRHSEFDNHPILLLTAKEDDDLRVELLESGAQDYLTKPFLPQELMARAGNLVAVKRAGDELRAEMASASNNVEELAIQLTARHRQLQAALEATEVARVQAQQASEVKTRFLAMISHEMRTPLSTLSMNAQLLGRTAKASSLAADAQLDRMIRATHQLTTMIEGLLEYARMETGKLEPRPGEVDVVELARDVVDMGQLQILSQDVKLNLDSPDSLPRIVTDVRLLRVAMNNLVSNALKFTRSGTVTLRVMQNTDTQCFEVHDTGIGIDEQDLDRIFHPFEQLEPMHHKNTPGVGLGLALCREIMEVLGGSIEVSSRKGEGSVFRLCLPVLTPP